MENIQIQEQPQEHKIKSHTREYYRLMHHRHNVKINENRKKRAIHCVLCNVSFQRCEQEKHEATRKHKYNKLLSLL